MLITLFDRNGLEKATLSPNDSSTQVKEVQGENVLSLSFTLYEYVELDVNDYVDYCGERYWMTERYKPVMRSTVEWVYDVKLYGVESLIGRYLVRMMTDGADEVEFTLTAPPVEHVRLIVSSINDAMGVTDFNVGVVVGTENVVMDYRGKYCDEALKELADELGVEWWMDGETVNLCRCERGEPLTLAYGRGLTKLERDTAENVKFYTRLFPIGSSRNIDPEHYGHSRLQLPEGAKYVDVESLVEEYGVIHHYEKDAFSGIYPRRVGKVSGVRHADVVDADGNPYVIWYFKDAELDFNPNDYKLPNAVMRVSFLEGSELAGLGSGDEGYFEVNYDSEAKEFEIITVWPYDDDTQLPGGSLVPAESDEYILWNLRMPDRYYALAERELQEAVESYNAEHGVDVSRYKGQTDHVWVENAGADIYVGRRVRLESEEFFGAVGWRGSRVTKITRRVNLPSLIDVEVSDALSTGMRERIDDDITEVRNYTRSLSESFSLPDIIKTGDATQPTDSNLFSAKRVVKQFLDKETDASQKVKGAVTFEEKVNADGDVLVKGSVVAGEAVRTDRIQAKDAEAVRVGDDVVVEGSVQVGPESDRSGRKTLRVGEVVDDFETGHGSVIRSDGSAAFDRLDVRYAMRVQELVINELQINSGDQIYSEGDTIDSVEEDGTAEGVYTLGLKNQHESYVTGQRRGNILRGIINTLAKAAFDGKGTLEAEAAVAESGAYYTCWMLVQAVHQEAGNNYLTVQLYPDDANVIPGGKNFAPCPLMVVQRWGNVLDEDYQSVTYLNAHDGRLYTLNGVTTPIVTLQHYGFMLGRPNDELVARYGEYLQNRKRSVLYVDGLLAANFFQIRKDGKAAVTYVEYAAWEAGVTYYFESVNAETGLMETSYVWHKGCKWLCLVTGTVDEPRYDSPYWYCVEGYRDFSVSFAEVEQLYDPDHFEATLTLVAKLGYTDVTGDLLDADIVWTRITKDGSGEVRTASDGIWNSRHAAAAWPTGRGQLTLGWDDLDADGGMPSYIAFRCEATLRDGGSSSTAAAVFETTV